MQSHTHDGSGADDCCTLTSRSAFAHVHDHASDYHVSRGFWRRAKWISMLKSFNRFWSVGTNTVCAWSNLSWKSASQASINSFDDIEYIFWKKEIIRMLHKDHSCHIQVLLCELIVERRRLRCQNTSDRDRCRLLFMWLEIGEQRIRRHTNFSNKNEIIHSGSFQK